MKKIKCPICQKELEQDSIQCPYCKYRFKIVPKRVNSPEDNKMRLDGYLVSDIRDCLVHTEEDTLERFRSRSLTLPPDLEETFGLPKEACLTFPCGSLSSI